MTPAITERAEQMGMTKDYLRDNLEQNKMLEDLRASVLQEKVYKFIQDSAQITEEEPPAEPKTPSEKEETQE